MATLFIIAEVLFVPGGVLGVVGGLLLLFAIYLPYAEGYTVGAHLNLGAIVLFLAIALFASIRSKTWKRMELSKDISSKVKENMDTFVAIGDRGVSVSRLTPMGKARFGEQFLEVKSYTGFVDQHTDIVVVGIEKDKIIVKPLI
jgi:membrane-bound ClpP family serine protease